MAYPKGTTFSKEHKRKISESHKGVRLSVFHRQKISEALKGKKQSPELIAKRIASRKGYRHSKETIEKIRLGNLGKKMSLASRKKMSLHSAHNRYWLGKKRHDISGSKSHMWIGNKVGYYGIHDWLTAKYGKAKKCESSKCKGKFQKFHWAKKKNKKYERKRSNFWQLCISCHRLYDDTPENREKIRKTLKEKSYLWERNKLGRFIGLK